ncbi:MAG: lipopolysaccharide assembly protein LapA domain-containing protein, partial [Candidatus Methanomethyliaceae archaeon]
GVIIRLFLLVVILLVLLVFTLQNTDPVEVTFWPWKVVLSKALLIIASLLIGFLLGFLAAIIRRK